MLGSDIETPSHVSALALWYSDQLLQFGGLFWTLCYAFFVRASMRDRTYGMPMFSIANNLAMDSVFGLFLASDTTERVGFASWALIQLGMAYAVCTYGSNEWAHAPAVQGQIRKIFALMLTGCVLMQLSFTRWWIQNDIGAHRGKTFYGHVGGPDMMELAFWSALVLQVYFAAASLAQLLVRGHTGGVDWSVLSTRLLGTILGVYGAYAVRWWYWPEQHEYFVNPFALILMLVGLAADVVYVFVFAHIRKSETVLSDGRRVPAAAAGFTTTATELNSVREKN
ncbi:hypothetical protein EXIGLDRAFT_693587 [Exidia glandulosa HHB12029]|uniref:Uncharacterized protein n=1 Tax=Exidia glandulosa HHB12029 TaxID=1314781 RepID=A0A165H712_EXIGL|nr:hypothetical protein EXIGLDRAFT_693587 [Exidia glandulosa HHB12029]